MRLIVVLMWGSAQADKYHVYAASCRYLYKSNSPGVQDYLCNRLYGLPESGVERYLSQICQLVISRPFGSLERVLVALCASSLRIAVKVLCFSIWHFLMSQA